MRDYFKNIGLIIYLAIAFSCQEAYNPDYIDNDEKIPVIHGLITDDPGPYIVSINWASGFLDDTRYAVLGAKVTISDDKGNLEILRELGNGQYITRNGGITGTVGRTYKLRVELPDERIYESTPVLMRPKPEIDTVYADITEKDIADINSYGELVITKQDGLQVYADIHDQEDAVEYVRLTGKYVFQRTHQYGAPPFPTTVYCWFPTNFNNPPVVEHLSDVEGEKIAKSGEVGFLPYIVFRDSLDDTSSVPVSQGWVTLTSVYSISEDAFLYYAAIRDQLAATDRMFDPIPSQVPSNIKCVNDTSKLCCGLFDVAAKTFKYSAFRWNHPSEAYSKIDLEKYNMPVNADCQDTFPPDFWISPGMFLK